MPYKLTKHTNNMKTQTHKKKKEKKVATTIGPRTSKCKDE